ncbi:MAG: hypothetical protein ACW98F_11785 [Candidatus Hodarchaeales archaeon]|jgi:hypothetical protein
MGILTDIDYKSKIATLIILFISATAFLSGYYQIEITAQETDLIEEITELGIQVERMESTAQRMMADDYPKNTQIDTLTVTARQVDAEMEMLNGTLNNSERRAYANQILVLLKGINQTAKKLQTYQIANKFQGKNASYNYYVSTVGTEGFDYIITTEDWNEAILGKNFVVKEMSLPMYLTQYNFANINFIISANSIYSEPILSLTQVNSNVALKALYLPIFRGQQQIAENTKEAHDLKNLGDQISLGVSLTAVAVILAGLMSNRISERENLRNIQKMVDSKYSDQSKGRDLISIPVLLFSALVSILGVIIPILLG